MGHCILRRTIWAACVVGCCSHPGGIAAAQQAEAGGGGRNIRYYNTSWDFDDVDVATLTRRLGRVGLELPADLAGRISGELRVGVPWNSLTSGRAWRFGGTLTSPQLTVNGLLLRGIAIRLEYADGTLRLEQLQVRVPTPGAREADGVLTGAAAMQLVPRGRFTASPRLSGFPLAALGPVLETLRDIEGRVNGSLEAVVDVDRLRDPAAWNIAGPITLEGLTLRGTPPANASVQMTLQRGVLRARQFLLNAGATQLTSEATLTLAGRQPWTLDAAIAAADLPELVTVVNALLEGDQWGQVADKLTAGAMRGTVQWAGTLAPWATARLSGHAELTNVAIETPEDLRQRAPLRPSITLERLAFDYRVAGGALQLTQLEAAAAGGRVAGAVTVPLGPGAVLANLEWSGLQPRQIMAEPFGGDGAAAGTLALTIPAGAMGAPAKWEARLDATLSAAAYGDWTATDVVTGPVALSAGRLRVPNFSAHLEGEPVALSLDALLNPPKTFSVGFNVPRVPLAWLRDVPQLAELAPGLAGVIGASGRISGEWDPVRVEGSGRVVGSDLRYQRHTIDAIEFNFTANDKRVSVSELQSRLYGGRLAGRATLGLGDRLAVTTQLSWDQVDAGQLLGGVDLGPIAVTGASSGAVDLAIPAGALEQVGKWRATANVRLQALDVYAWQFRQIQPISVTLADGQVSVPRLQAVEAGGSMQAAATLGIGGAWPLDVRGAATNVRIDRVAAVPALAALQGRVGGRADFNTRLQGTLSPASLSAAGDATLREARLDGYQVEQATFAYDYKPGSLSITGLNAIAYGGRVAGNVTIPLADDAAGTINAAWNGVDAAAATRPLGRQPFSVVGRTNGAIALDIPAGSLRDRTRWSGSATLDVDQLSVYAWQFTSIQPVQVRLAEGSIAVARLEALLDGSPLVASVRVGVAAPYDFEGTLDIEQFRFDRVGSIPQLETLHGRVGGVADVTASLRGTAEPLNVTANGTATAHGLRFDEHRVDRIGFKFALAPQALTLTDVDADVYGGRVTGSGVVPLSATTAGAAQVRWSDIDVGRAVAGFFPLPWELNGVASGETDLQIPAGALERPADWNFAASVAMPELRADGMAIAALDATATQHQGQLRYTATGALLGGALDMRGERPTGANALGGLAALGSMRISLRGAQLEQAAQLAAGRSESPVVVSGAVSLELQTTVVDNQWTWKGAVRTGVVNLAGRQLTTGVDVQAEGNAQAARLTNVTGQFAGGTLAGSGQWQFAPRSAGAFRVNLRGGELEQLATLASGEGDPPAAGPVDLELLVRPGLLWRIAGAAASPRIETAGLTFRNVRVPVDVAWHPPSGRTELRLNGVNLALSGGRINGRLEATRSYGWTLDGNFRFYRVNFTSLTGSSYGRGQLSGTLTVSGRNVRSASDVNATLTATLEDTQASNIPIISQLRNVVPGIGGSASSFGDGRVEAHLRRGVIRVEELTLASAQLQLYVTGQATLAGNLRLEAVVSTGDRIDSLIARSLVTRLAASAITPVALLVEANNFLANRVIHLAIGGTFERPSIRVLPFQTLREQVVRFFLQQAAGTVIPGAAGVGGLSAPSSR